MLNFSDQGSSRQSSTMVCSTIPEICSAMAVPLGYLALMNAKARSMPAVTCCGCLCQQVMGVLGHNRDVCVYGLPLRSSRPCRLRPSGRGIPCLVAPVSLVLMSSRGVN